MTVWMLVVVLPARGSPPAIVIGYVTPFVGSVYWNVQCGIVLARARNSGETPPSWANRATTSGFDCRVGTEAASAGADRSSASAPRTSVARRLDIRTIPLSARRAGRVSCAGSIGVASFDAWPA